MSFLCKILDIEQHVKKWYSNLAASRSAPGYLEIMNSRATKGHAVEILSQVNGISIEDTLAFGDNFNDMDMLQTAGMELSIQQNTE